jgi:DNA-binding SARP family transcriptional activator
MTACERPDSESLKFCILGPLKVRLGPGRPITVGPPLHRAVLAALLLRAGQPCPRDWLTEAVWGTQAPAKTASTLRTCVYGLRQFLGDDLGGRLRTYPGGFLLDLAPGEVDLQEFSSLDARGHLAWDRGETAAAAALLGEALRLWRKPALAALPGTPLMAAGKARLVSQYAAVQETWLDAELELGRHHEVVSQIWALARHDPLREHVWGQLMLALYRGGDAAGALCAYSAAQAAVAAEYGVEPGPELAELRRCIIAGSLPQVSGPAFGARRCS